MIKQSNGPVPRSSAVPIISAKCARARAEDPDDCSMVHPDEGLILSGDKVAAAHSAGGLHQKRQIVCHLTGTALKHRQILVSAIVANPQAGAAAMLRCYLGT